MSGLARHDPRFLRFHMALNAFLKLARCMLLIKCPYYFGIKN